MKNSSIKWTTHTFNTWWGCKKVGDECANCYAEAWAKRCGYDLWGKSRQFRTMSKQYWSQPLSWNSQAHIAGERHRVFVCSMGDVGDPEAPQSEREKLFGLIKNTPALDWMLLTKRPEHLRQFWPANWVESPPVNVFVGVSAGLQSSLDERVPLLLEIPAAGYFLSVEPLMESMNIAGAMKALHAPAVFVGGETGPKARPCHLEWIGQVVEQAGGRAQIKQLGQNAIGPRRKMFTRNQRGEDPNEWPPDLRHAAQPVDLRGAEP